MVIIVLGVVVLLISLVVITWRHRAKLREEGEKGEGMQGLVIYDEHGRETLNTSDRILKVRGVFTVPANSSITRNVTLNSGEQIVLLPSWLVSFPRTNPGTSSVNSHWDYSVNGNAITLINKHLSHPLHFIIGSI